MNLKVVIIVKDDIDVKGGVEKKRRKLNDCQWMKKFLQLDNLRFQCIIHLNKTIENLFEQQCRHC